jgi:hypothetical protein
MSIYHSHPTDGRRWLTLDKDGRPDKHWAGRTQATKVLRNWINNTTISYINEHEATDIVEDMLQAYLDEQR